MKTADKPCSTLFSLTGLAWKAYKKDDPAYQARNPRSDSFDFRWDLNAGLTKWCFYVVLMLLAFVADLTLLPFKIIQRIVSAAGQRKQIARDAEIKTARKFRRNKKKKNLGPVHPLEQSRTR